jgi:predicted TIM-barrel fold metal-dependent hydrolase
LHTHVATGDTNPPSPGPGHLSMVLAELGYCSRRHLAHMVFGAVFDRFPDLTVTLTEQGGTWIRDAMRTMDSIYRSTLQERETPHITDVLRHEPSYYFHHNVFVCASFASRFEVFDSVEGGYADRLMWGRDFPHPEGTWPFTRESIRSSFCGVAEPQLRNILGESAVRALGLDKLALEAVAHRVGPSVAEVSTPIDTTGLAYGLCQGFRHIGPYA